jgi:nifR3 family TIM-barrel protein
MAYSEMVSSHAIHYGNRRTVTELLRLHEDEAIVSIQLFGSDPEVMRSAAAHVASTTDAQLIDLNMGCPVTKVCRTGAGAALLGDPELAIELTRAAREGGGLPVTVKLRSGLTAGDRSGFDLAHRLVDEAGAAAIAFHPRSAGAQHRGVPDYELAAELVRTLDAPVILSGGLSSAAAAREAFERVRPAAVMLARGALGNPWLFEELLGRRSERPDREQILAELGFLMDGAIEHMGSERAARYMRKFYPWYVRSLGGDSALQDAVQRAGSIDDVRSILGMGAAGRRAPAPLLL